MNEVLAKPIHLETLREVLTRLVGRPVQGRKTDSAVA